jgi:glycosyltransferase involved in cell wall biosynthesis
MDDLDLIIVDDGSIDDTLSTVKPYLADRRVRYTYQNNTGLPGARNTGARLSTAPFIAFLDADDALSTEALARMSAAVHESGASWCVIDLLKVRSGSQQEVRKTDIPPGHLLYAILADDFIRRGMFFRRQSLFDIGLYDDEMRNREDWDINIRMIEHGHKFVYIPEPLYLYSWREDSITTGNPCKMLRYTERLLRKHHKRLADAGDIRVRRLYSDNMWALARRYAYALRRAPDAFRCMRESLSYDFSARRIVHPLLHHLQRLTS